MKVYLNEAEVKLALTQFVKSNFLNYESFDIEVLDFTDDCNCSLDHDVKVIIGVNKQPAAPVAPVAPVAEPTANIPKQPY